MVYTAHERHGVYVWFLPFGSMVRKLARYSVCDRQAKTKDVLIAYK